MTDDAKRRYRDREVELILRRAAELQRDSEDELGLAELEEIASRVGIDVENLRRAAESLDEIGPLPSTMDSIVGGPVTIWLERTLEGEIPDDSVEELALEVDNATGTEGSASQIGRSLRWRAVSNADGTARALMVTVSWRGGETYIRILERLHGTVGGLFGGLVGGMGVGAGLGIGLGVGLGALGSPLFATLFPPAMLAGSFLLARTIYGRVFRQRDSQLRELLDVISDYVEEGTDEAPSGETE